MLSTSARQTQIKQQFSLLNCLESRARFCEFDSKSLSRHWLSSLLAPSPTDVALAPMFTSHRPPRSTSPSRHCYRENRRECRVWTCQTVNRTFFGAPSLVALSSQAVHLFGRPRARPRRLCPVHRRRPCLVSVHPGGVVPPIMLSRKHDSALVILPARRLQWYSQCVLLCVSNPTIASKLFKTASDMVKRWVAAAVRGRRSGPECCSLLILSIRVLIIAAALLSQQRAIAPSQMSLVKFESTPPWRPDEWLKGAAPSRHWVSSAGFLPQCSSRSPGKNFPWTTKVAFLTVFGALRDVISSNCIKMCRDRLGEMKIFNFKRNSSPGNVSLTISLSWVAFATFLNSFQRGHMDKFYSLIPCDNVQNYWQKHVIFKYIGNW